MYVCIYSEYISNTVNEKGSVCVRVREIEREKREREREKERGRANHLKFSGKLIPLHNI